MKPIVIWDMGGILYRYFTEMIVDHGRAAGWPINEMPLGPTHPVADANYEAMDRGELTEPQYLKLCIDMLATHGIDFYPPSDLDWSDEFRRPTWDTIESLHKRGYRQAVLTNDASKWLGDNWWNTWEQARYFEKMIDVKTIGIRKPAPEPYLACIKAMDAEPADCVFIDDMHTNCEGSEAVGMPAIWFDITNPTESLARLENYLNAG